MTETRTRAHRRTTERDLRSHLLALVLFVVLVWYTVVSPSYAPAPTRVAGAESPDAEEREVETQAGGGFAASGAARAVASRPDRFGAGDEEDEFDWPEIIGGD